MQKSPKDTPIPVYESELSEKVATFIKLGELLSTHQDLFENNAIMFIFYDSNGNIILRDIWNENTVIKFNN